MPVAKMIVAAILTLVVVVVTFIIVGFVIYFSVNQPQEMGLCLVELRRFSARRFDCFFRRR